MSFYSVLRDKFPDKKEGQVAEMIGRPLMTLRNWKHQEPRASLIIEVAEHLGVRPEDLFREFADDQIANRGKEQ